MLSFPHHSDTVARIAAVFEELSAELVHADALVEAQRARIDQLEAEVARLGDVLRRRHPHQLSHHVRQPGADEMQGRTRTS